jgi:voltage-gated potassium channel
VLVVLYYVLPLDRPWNGDTAVRVLIGLLVIVGITGWQVRTIAGSRYPGVRAVEALGLILPLYLLVFASTYYVMERASVADFTQPLTRTDALYFTVTVFSTVGFGDIVPRSEAARVVLMVQMLGDFALLGAGARILLEPSAAASSRGRIQVARLIRQCDLTGIAEGGDPCARWNARQSGPSTRGSHRRTVNRSTPCTTTRSA